MTASTGRFHLTLAHPAAEPRAASDSAGSVSPGASSPRASAAEAVELEAEAVQTGSPRELLRVGDLAKITGKTVRAIHHYEELGLIEPAGRSKGHYRLFAADTPVRIRWISKLQSLGLSLGEIRTLVKNRHASSSAQQSAGHLRAMYEEKLLEVRSRLAELSALERELEASLLYLDSCNTSCTPELVPTDCAQCERHAEEYEPDLISGALV